ncbi:MAG: hypothetical protein L3K02_06590 [Thermoplasmata archaeon]|nr:hypothetical protein [Thermoplasmata archaeon]
MVEFPSQPVPCCANCVPAHRADWEIRPNPFLFSGGADIPCAFCGAPQPVSILTVACPVGAGDRAN